MFRNPMPERKEKKIFLKPGDGLPQVIRLFEKAGEGIRFTIHVPADSALAGSLDNFHTIQREASRRGIEVVIVSTDRHVEDLAYAARLGARNSVFGKNERPIVDIIKAKPSKRTNELLVAPAAPLPRKPEKKEPRVRFRIPAPAIKMNMRLFAIAGIALVFVGGAGAIGSAYFPRATIVLSLIQTPVSFEKIVTVRTDVSNYSVGNGDIVLPGERFTSTKNVVETFPATGSSADSGKATGNIYIYNERSSEQILVANTRFVSKAGLTYRIPNRVTVPAAVGGTAGTVRASVVADEAGESYNGTPAKDERWTIPGFKDYGLMDQYQKIYGVPAGALTGGATGTHAVATAEDVAVARDNVTGILRSVLLKDMNVTRKNDLVSLEGAQEFSLTAFEANQSVGKDGTFSVFAEGTLADIVFRESDLEAAVLAAVRAPVDYDVTMSEPKFTFTSPAFRDGALQFTVQGTFTAVPVVDVESVERQLAGQTQASVKTMLFSIPGLKSAQVNLWPGFFKNIPQDAKKVVIKIGE